MAGDGADMRHWELQGNYRRQQVRTGSQWVAPRPIALAILVLSGVAMFLAPSAQASKNVVGYFGSEGPGIGQFTRFPEGVVVNDAGTGPGVSPGDVYVISGARPAKIHQFDAQGNLVRTVGWDIVHSGPDNTGANEQDTVTVPNTVTAGTFKLSVTTVLGEAQSHGEFQHPDRCLRVDR